MPPSAYIHIPFCRQKCIYCDFYSIGNTEKINAYIDALIAEIEIRSQKYAKNIAPKTIYIGGGTPSVLEVEQLSKLTDKIRDKFDISDLEEFTIEINPGTINKEKLAEYLRLGINRLSIGVQSLNGKELSFLHRIHSSSQAIEAIDLAKEAGFDNISCDVIYSVPGQTADSLKYTIDTLIGKNIQHISAYTLTYEEGTPLYNKLTAGEILKNPDSLEQKLYIQLCKYLSERGYAQYEISNFAVSGYESQHNLNYWRRNEYFGFGASAHSYLDGNRFYNYSDVDKYISLLSENILPVLSEEHLTKEQRYIEAVYLGLRAEGINLKAIKREFGIDLYSLYGKLMHNLISQGKASLCNDILKLNALGYALCDYLTVQLINSPIKE